MQLKDVTKNSHLVFRWKTRCFELYSTENIFWLVGNETELLWALYRKNQRFCFFLAKRRCIQLNSTKKKCFGLFAIKVCVFQWYCTGKRFSFGLHRVHSNFPWFYSKQRFYSCLAKLRCSRFLLLRTTSSSSFVRRLHIWRSILLSQKNSVFSLLCLKYVAFSFIAGRTCFGLFAVTVGSSQRYCNGKRFSPSLQRVTLIFTWFYSTKRFRLFPARLRCFQQYVYENRLFLSSLPKLRFWPFILPKPSFGLSQNKVFLLFFVAETSWIRIYSTKNMFWFVCCNIGLFAVLLHQKGVFFQYAGSHPDFHSILLKQRFCFLLAKLRCLRIVFLRTEDLCLEEQPLPFFVHKLRCLPFILPKKHVLGSWQLQWKLRALAHKKQQFGFSLQNTPL